MPQEAIMQGITLLYPDDHTPRQIADSLARVQSGLGKGHATIIKVENATTDPDDFADLQEAVGKHACLQFL
jgi:hypothetical protein